VIFSQHQAIKSSWAVWCRMSTCMSSSKDSAKRAASFHKFHRIASLFGRWSCESSCRMVQTGTIRQSLLQRERSAMASLFFFWIDSAQRATQYLWQIRVSAAHLVHVLLRRSFGVLSKYRIKRLLVRQRTHMADRFHYSLMATRTLASLSHVASAIIQAQVSTTSSACHAEASARSRTFLSWARSSQLTSSARAVQSLCAARR
jgi:hypothetical protein